MYPFSCPRLFPREFSKSDYDVVDHLSLIVSQPTSYAEDFQDALSLFDYCHEQRSVFISLGEEDELAKAWQREFFSRLSSWQLVAARDGAMSIFQFGESMKFIKAGVHMAPSLSVMIDSEAWKSANRRFKKDFPRFEAMRHAVAHSAEMIKTRAHLKKNSAGQMFIQSSLSGRQFQATYDGKLLSYEMSQETLNKLTLVLSEFYRAFRRADGFVRPKTSKHPKP